MLNPFNCRLLKYFKKYVRFAGTTKYAMSLVVLIHAATCCLMSLQYDSASYVEEGSSYMDIYGDAFSTVLGAVLSATPPSNVAPVFSISLVTIGFLLVAALLSEIIVLVSSKQSNLSAFRDRVDKLNSQLKYHLVPPHVRFRARRNMDYLWLNSLFNHRPLHMNTDLSPALRKVLVFNSMH